MFIYNSWNKKSGLFTCSSIHTSRYKGIRRNNIRWTDFRRSVRLPFLFFIFFSLCGHCYFSSNCRFLQLLTNTVSGCGIFIVGHSVQFLFFTKGISVGWNYIGGRKSISSFGNEMESKQNICIDVKLT